MVDPKGGSETPFEARKGESGFYYTFDLEGVVPDKEEGKYTFFVTAVDEDGLVTEKEYKARIYHDPPPEPIQIFPFGIEYGAGIFAFPAILVLLILVYSGLVLFNTVVQRKDQRKKKALLEKMKSEEKKKDTTIEDEIHAGVDSQKYLESTGLAKGSDQFTKELTAASAKPDQAAVPPASTPKQLPAAPVNPPAAGPPKPAVQPQNAPPTKPPVAQPKPAAPANPPAAPPAPAQATAAPARPPAAPPAPPRAPPAPKQ
jgi:hypothetical protein